MAKAFGAQPSEPTPTQPATTQPSKPTQHSKPSDLAATLNPPFPTLSSAYIIKKRRLLAAAAQTPGQTQLILKPVVEKLYNDKVAEDMAKGKGMTRFKEEEVEAKLQKKSKGEKGSD